MRALLLAAAALPLVACGGHASADGAKSATPVPATTATAAAVSTPLSASPGATTIDAVLADPAKHHGARVHLRGVLTVGFEASHLDGKAWVRVGSYEGFPDGWRDGRGVGRAEVEVHGTIDTEKGRYGHLGKYRAHVNADRVVYLGPAK